MAGLLQPSAGQVLIRGRSAWRQPEIYRDLGLVPEKEAVHPYLSGYEFALLNAQLHGVAGSRRPRPMRAIETVDLVDAAHRPTGTYSKGMRQRAKIAGALVHEPSVLLLDEPFNGMDPRQRLHMMDLLRSMAAAGPDDPVLVAHPRGSGAAGRLHPRRPRRAAGGGRRLPLDPAAHDRPAAHASTSARPTTAGWRRR